MKVSKTKLATDNFITKYHVYIDEEREEGTRVCRDGNRNNHSNYVPELRIEVVYFNEII